MWSIFVGSDSYGRYLVDRELMFCFWWILLVVFVCLLGGMILVCWLCYLVVVYGCLVELVGCFLGCVVGIGRVFGWCSVCWLGVGVVDLGLVCWDVCCSLLLGVGWVVYFCWLLNSWVFLVLVVGFWWCSRYGSDRWFFLLVGFWLVYCVLCVVFCLGGLGGWIGECWKLVVGVYSLVIVGVLLSGWVLVICCLVFVVIVWLGR